MVFARRWDSDLLIPVGYPSFESSIVSILICDHLLQLSNFRADFTKFAWVG
jgi:hypothetical protein